MSPSCSLRSAKPFTRNEPEPGSFLSPTCSSKFKQWVQGVYSGLSTRNITLRGAALGGLLLGLEEVKEEFDARVVGSRVEDEVVVAFAELFDASNTGDDREQEFDLRQRAQAVR